MSLVLAIKRDDVVYLGADTRVTQGDRIYSELTKDDFKIRRVGSCYIGTAGSVDAIQLMTQHHEWFELNGETLTKKFLVQNVIPQFYDILESMDKLIIKEDEWSPPDSGCSFLVTDGKKLFLIDGDFEVVELSKYGQIGCTKNISAAFMLNALDDYSPNELILKVLRTSAYRNDGVGAPYVLLNTKDEKFEIVEE